MVVVIDDDASTFGTVARVGRDLGLNTRPAQTAESALAIARSESPAVLISSIDLAGESGGLAIGRTFRQRFGSAVIFTAPALSAAHVAAVAAFNPDAFLCKPLRSEQIDATLRLALKSAALSGRHRDDRQPAGAELMRALRQIAAVVHGTGVIQVGPSPSPNTSTLAALRPREQEVVRLLFEHCRVPAIASRMGISPQTVRNHLKHIFASLGVHSQQELIARLREGVAAPATSVDTPEAD